MSTFIQRYINSSVAFTLIELIVATVVIGLLSIVSVPTVQAYFERARVTKGVSIARTVQAALASSATTSNSYQYPASISSYGDLTLVVNANGAQLADSEADSGIVFRLYTPIDTVGDSIWDSYTMSFTVARVSKKRRGWCIVVLPSGIEKCEPE